MLRLARRSALVTRGALVSDLGRCTYRVVGVETYVKGVHM